MNGRQSKGKGRFEAGQSSSQFEGAAQANMLQHNKGKRKQPGSGDKCFKCGGTGHWSKEWPNAHVNNKVGSHLHSFTSDPVGVIATGANAMPVRRLKTNNKLVVSVDGDCMADVHADLHSSKQPSENALSEHGLTMSFTGIVGCEATQDQLPQQARGGGESCS